MTTEIAVLAYDRPRYLQVTLDALFRMRGISGYPVFLYVDGGPGSAQAAIRRVADLWPLSGVICHGANLNNMHSIIFAFGDRFEDAADEVLLVEEDFILRPDTLRYVERSPRDAFFLSLIPKPDGGGSGAVGLGYCSWGNVLSSEAFSELRYWIERRAYDGLDRPYAGGKLHASLTGHDAMFSAFVYATGRTTRFSDAHYPAHFGLAGRNAPAPDQEFCDLEARLFAGSRDLWLGNVVRILETRDYSDRFQIRLGPRDFVYGKRLPCWDGHGAAWWPS